MLKLEFINITKWLMTTFKLILFQLTLIFTTMSCSKVADLNPTSSAPTVEPSSLIFEVSYDRENSAGFGKAKGTIKLLIENKPILGATSRLKIETAPSNHSAIDEKGDGLYGFTITPTRSGEVAVEVSFEGQSRSESLLIFQGLSNSFGQPLAIKGDVNTDGWEDGAVIHPNGELFFAQYIPIHASAMFNFSTFCASSVLCDWSHPWIKYTHGPVSSPKRPDFFNSRIELDGALAHRFPLFDFDPIYSPPSSFYGFKRMADGSFSEPFLIGVDDGNYGGGFGPYGLGLQPINEIQSRIVFAWDDPLDAPDTGFDIFTDVITHGEKNILGIYQRIGGVPTQLNFSPIRLGFPDHSGVQGNPHLYSDANGLVKSVWVDSENDSDNTNDLTAYILTDPNTFPSGPWIKKSLPSKLDTPARGETQPFFNGKYLYYRGELELLRSEYLGGDFSLETSWSDPVVVIQPASIATGNLVAVGEPSIATQNGKTYLYFIYAIDRGAEAATGVRDFDLNAGYVEILE